MEPHGDVIVALLHSATSEVTTSIVHLVLWLLAVWAQ